jgi:hypothetical protein
MFEVVEVILRLFYNDVRQEGDGVLQGTGVRVFDLQAEMAPGVSFQDIEMKLFCLYSQERGVKRFDSDLRLLLQIR